MDHKGSVRIGAVCICNVYYEEISFWDIFFDERVVEGDVWVNNEALCDVGGVNSKLPSKKNYELLLRIAYKYDVVKCNSIEDMENIGNFDLSNYTLLPKDEDVGAGVFTDCYLIGRYKTELLQCDMFNASVEQIVACGDEDKDNLLTYLEDMITGGTLYQELFAGSQPILIYHGDMLCYSVLDNFALQLGRALEEKGQKVEYYDVSQNDIRDIAKYEGRTFKAVIGMQTYMFSVKRNDGTLFHDKVIGPKFNWIFDHPAYMQPHLVQVPKELRVLTLDRNYADFVETYFQVKGDFLPPGGKSVISEKEKLQPIMSRKYRVTFVGSYYCGFEGKLKDLLNYGRQERRFIFYFIRHTKENLNNPPEEAVKSAMKDLGIPYSRESFLEHFIRLHQVIYDISQYYRGKVLHAILQDGIELHVFGDSWKQSPFMQYPNLVWHQEVCGDESLRVYGDSVISLNIMAWHKDAITERVINILLQKTILLTDWSRYLEENLEDGKQCVLFDLNHIEEVPGKIQTLLANPALCERIAENGYELAVQKHTWNQRADEFLQLL